jgi:hypothetical protein
MRAFAHLHRHKEVAKRLAGLRKRRRRAPISLSVEGYYGPLSGGPGWR